MDTAEVAAVEEGAGGEAGGVEAVLGNDAEEAVGVTVGGEEGVAAGDVHFHGFFGEDVFAGAEGGCGEGAVVAAGSAEGDGVDGEIGEHLFPSAGGDVKLGGEAGGGGGVEIDAGDELRVGGEGGEGACLGAADVAAADKGKGDGTHERK